MRTTRQIRTVLRTERARLLGMETVIARPVRHTSTFVTGR